MSPEEQKIRERVSKLSAHEGISPEFTLLSVGDSALLLSELTRLREALNEIHAEASERCDERLRGWERWHKVYDFAMQALR